MSIRGSPTRRPDSDASPYSFEIPQLEERRSLLNILSLGLDVGYIPEENRSPTFERHDVWPCRPGDTVVAEGLSQTTP